MKKFSMILLTASLLLGISASAMAQEGIEASAKYLETLVTKLQSMLNADNVLGAERVIGDIKIIPVVGYGFGFGAASGIGGDKEGKGAGAGGGAGGGIMPASILLITKDGEVQVLSVRKGAFSDLLEAIVPIALEAIKAEQMKQQETPKPESNP